MKTSFKDATVLITGGSVGIGAALAVELGRRGARVAVLARRKDLLDQVVARTREASAPDAMAIEADVARHESILAATKAVEKSLGPLDLLIANAGIWLPVDPLKFDSAPVERTFGVNFFGALYSIEAALPGMIERGHGHIVVMSSLAAFRGLPTSSAYSASKAALRIFVESFRCELEPKGIRFTTVNPGYVETDLTAQNKFKMPFMISAEQAARKIAQGVEAGRREISFPWQTALGVRFMAALPNSIFDQLGRRFKP